jgi:hypothetical protein
MVDRGSDLAAFDDELQFIPQEHHDFIVMQARPQDTAPSTTTTVTP